KVAPPSRLNSTSAVPAAGRLLAQVMVCAVPTRHDAPAAGAVTASAGVTIPNTPLAPLAAAGSLVLTRTRAGAVAGPLTVQAKLPVLGAAAANVSKVAPPSRLSSTTIDALGGRFVDHVTACALPA